MPAGLMADAWPASFCSKDWEATEDFLAALRWQSAAAAGIVFVLALAGAVVFAAGPAGRCARSPWPPATLPPATGTAR